MNVKVLVFAVATAAAIAAPLAAQAGEVYNREGYQEARIYNGVRDGQLGPREYANLQTREARLNAARQADLARHDGHLTPWEAGHLNQRENAISRSIWTDRHN
jgi:hypothetical protein